MEFYKYDVAILKFLFLAIDQNRYVDFVELCKENLQKKFQVPSI